MVRHTRESGPKSRSGQAEKKPQRTERIAKRLARAGVASRREVERLIGLGLVAVNGRILATPAVLVSRDDVVTVEGQVVGAAEATRLWRYHKPQGLLTTNKDPKDRATVFEHLPQDLPRVVTVGRLDLNSEGLLLLTNDGGLARALELPANAWRRVYRARALGRITQAKLDKLKDGVVVEGVSYGSIEATLDKAKEKDDGRANVWITVALNEGKNREVRRVLEHLGLKVNRLLRLAYGPFQLGTLAQGEVEEVGPRVIREQLAEFIPAENLPTGARTATATPGAGRRPGSALADPRRKPSRVRAGEEKAAAEALERETAPKRERVAREERAGARKPFGGKPRRESGFGDKKPRAEGAYGARKSARFGEKRSRDDRPGDARKSAGFGKKRDGDLGERKTSAYGEKKPRGGGFGEKRERPAGKSAGFGDKRKRPATRTGGFSEKRERPATRPGGFGEKRERPATRSGGFGEKREQPSRPGPAASARSANALRASLPGSGRSASGPPASPTQSLAEGAALRLAASVRSASGRPVNLPASPSENRAENQAALKRPANPAPGASPGPSPRPRPLAANVRARRAVRNLQAAPNDPPPAADPADLNADRP